MNPSQPVQERKDVRVPFDPFPLARYRNGAPGESASRVVPGLSPALADRLAAVMGVPPSSPERVLANLLMALEEAAQNGHTCMVLDGLVEATAARLSLDTEALGPYIARFQRDGRLVIEQTAGSSPLVYDPGLHRAETDFAQGVSERLGMGILPHQETLAADLDPDQLRAVRMAFRCGVSALVGGPGRGKSHTLVAIARECQRARVPALLTATTGRAAMRLAELAEAAGVDLPVAPGTVHRVLGLMAKTKPELPPPPALLVIDEASMLDVDVAARAMLATPSGYRLLFVGDSGQLPSVGPGTVLWDLISSLPQGAVTELSHNHRTDSPDLGRAIDAIREGRAPAGSEHFRRVELGRDELVSNEAVARLVADVRDQVAEHHGVDPVDGVMVITPRAAGGPGLTTSTANLNPALRRLSNPAAMGLSDRDLAQGDRVVNVQNDYEIGVMNGEVGRVVTSSSGRGGRRLVVAFPDREVAYEDDEIDRLVRLAYITTIHKAQGGEAPCVVVLLRRSDGLLLGRRLAYTAVSRARYTTVVLAEAGALETAVANRREERRIGMLAERIRGLRGVG